MILRSIIFGLLFSSSVMAASYQVITDKLPLVDKIKGLSTELYRQGRVHLVELSDESFAGLSTEERQFLRPLTLAQIQNEFSYASKRGSEHPMIPTLLSQMSGEKMRETVAQLGTYRSRYVGSEGNRQAVEWVIEQFKSFGLEVRSECFSTWNGQACNAIAYKPGKTANKKYVVMGHIDTVGRAFAGADDNGSGVAGVLELARILSSQETQYGIEFVAVNAEEIGIVGSNDYVNRQVALQKDEILAALTMDVIGYNTKNVFTIETYPEHEQLAQDLAAYGRSYTSRQVMVSLHAWGSDHIPFLDQKIPATLTSQDWSNHNPCYHKACDTIEKVDFDYAKDLAVINLAYLTEKTVL